MRPIPPKLRDELANDPYMSKCARAKDGGCDGRTTWEHAIIYAGKQLNERWAIIPLCEHHHLRKGLDKRKNEWIALCRATDQELATISKAKDWKHYKNYLSTFYE